MENCFPIVAMFCAFGGRRTRSGGTAELDCGDGKKVYAAHGKHGERDLGDEAAPALILRSRGLQGVLAVVVVAYGCP